MSHNVDPLREYRMWRRYAYRFLPSFGGALLLCLNSIAGNMAHGLASYAKIHHLPTEYAFVTGATLCLIFFIGQTLLCEGSLHAQRVLVFVAIVNILLATGYLANHSPTLLNLLPLFSALLYILTLNSKNHRRYVSILRVKRRRKLRTNTAAL
ncbi:hypothetical protein IFT48_09400 [Pseudomonas fluorescens]|uniref:hypothetical protein n=1 Tax=Pseudomonas TaxID=286 RepID=UPI0019050109|nr:MULTISPECIES: hypothetical protein [Pseudomonas]MBD8090196.1 hypothetical protein [Pseudomonas fluorescens]MBD8716434.1 hypothetical protein [Pseudomonas fluorescens]MDL2187954.1 hypothetical protein [Pseudomonas sp. ChxA]